jgi:sialic acid synthase SpsE
MKIGDVQIGRNHKRLIVAEMFGHHNQSVIALAIVEAAARAGAHALSCRLSVGPKTSFF